MYKIFFPKLVVESLGNVPGKFQMLLLVFTNWHKISMINQNIRRLQYRISEKPQTYKGLFISLPKLIPLVLELGHARQFAVTGGTAEYPGQFNVFGYKTLNEQVFRLYATGQKIKNHLPGVLAQLHRVVGHRHGVIIHHAIEAFIVVLEPHPILYRAKVIAQVKIARRLYAGENVFH